MLLVNAIFVVVAGYWCFHDLARGRPISACFSGAVALLNAGAIVLR